MKNNLLILLMLVCFSCGIFNTGENTVTQKLYVCVQGENQVAVYNTPSLSLLKLIDVDFSNEGNMPHFVVLDEINNYWFVTGMGGGYVAQFNLLTDEFIDTIAVGNNPALMTIDPINKKLFCSRMEMGGMGGMGGMDMMTSNVITGIHYTDEGMILGDEFNSNDGLQSEQLHAITYDNNKENIITASMSDDWLYKISLIDNSIDNLSLHSSSDGYEITNEPKLLTPIQVVLLNDSLIALSCNAPGDGPGKLNGQVQMWNINTDPMSKVVTYEFNALSLPWHLIKSPVTDDIFVVLRGDSGEGGIVRLAFNEESFTIKWEYRNVLFDTFHGITIDGIGQYIYVTSAGENSLYQFSASNGALIDETQLGMNPGGLSIMQSICTGCE